MIFLRIVFVAGYLFWGGMFLQAFSELMLKNVWFDLFSIQKVTPKSIEFIPQEKESTDIKYEFEFDNKIYSGHRSVINQIIVERLPKDKNEIEVSFNSRFPNVNYLDQLGLTSRTGFVGMLISGFFIMFLVLIDLFGNKKKWLNRYGIVEKTKANPQ